MKKFLKYFMIFATVLVVLWIVVRLTNILQIYRTPTSSNYPTIETGEWFLSSRLVNPKRFDFICFRVELPEEGKQTYVHRLCGIPGDTIRIDSGRLYVNGVDADKSLTLAHTYIVPAEEYERLKDYREIVEASTHAVPGDSIVLSLTDAFVRSNRIRGRKEILAANYPDQYIKEVYNQPWNQDHFGPVVVPPGKYFTLGDNRHSSQDSRYLGFVDSKDFVGTVLGKK